MDEIALNRQIAELLGYKAKYDTDGYGAYTVIVSPTGEEITFTLGYGISPEQAWESFTSPVYRKLFSVAPRWATDTARALTLLDELPQDLWVIIHRGFSRSLKKICWYCQIESASGEQLASATRLDTQAEAICYAFIEYKASQSS